MFIRIKETVSINNLKNKDKAGQIATILILIMVVILIAILVTVNLGKVSIDATNIANAADSASLALASMLGSKARSLWQQMDYKFSDSVATGMLAMLLAIVAAIVVTVVSYGSLSYPAAIAVAAVAGAIGGAIGAAIAGTPMNQGIIQGFVVGAAIGVAYGAGVEIAAGAEETMTALAAEGVGTAEQLLVYEQAVQMAALAAYAPAAMVSLTAGSNLYNAYVGDQSKKGAIESAIAALNNLTEYDRYREQMFFFTFAKTIDDPTKVNDTLNIDNDTSTDKVAYFHYWWKDRARALEDATIRIRALTAEFIEQSPGHPLQDCNDFISAVKDGTEDSYAGLLSQDINISPIARAAVALGVAFYPDEYLGLRNELSEVEAMNAEIMGQDATSLTNSWDTWFKWYYDPDSTAQEPSGYYAEIDKIVQPMLVGPIRMDGQKSWVDQIRTARDRLNYCTFGEYDSDGDCGSCWTGTMCRDCIFDTTNVPCKFYEPDQGTIGADTQDDFLYAIVRIEYISATLNQFKQKIKQYYDAVKAALAGINIDEHGGLNPAHYNWTDSRGKHSMQVEAGQFKMAWIRQWSSGNWVVGRKNIALMDYTDADQCKVRVTRLDEIKEIRSGTIRLGWWNPYDPDNDGYMNITRFSKAGYDPNVATRKYRIYLKSTRW